MRCLDLRQIYSFLEKEISPSEGEKIKNHISVCLKCSKAFEERELFHRAVESMPSWKTPPGFTRMVMEKIFSTKVSLWKTLTAFGMGFASFLLLFVVYLRTTDQNISSVFFSLLHTLQEQIKSIFLVLVKLLKLTSFLLKILCQVGEAVLKGLLQLTMFVDPEIQILIISMLILTTSFIYGMGRKFLTGEK